jgi:hypothetical protein
LQRWVSADPLEVHVGGSGDLNLYAYVSGRALKAIDPLGLQAASGAGGELKPKEGQTVSNPSLSQYGQQPAKVVSEPPARAQAKPAGASDASREAFDPISDLQSKDPKFGLGNRNTVMGEVAAGVGLLTGAAPGDVKVNDGGDPGGIPGGQCTGERCVSGAGVQAVWAGVVTFGGAIARAGRAIVTGVGKAIGGAASKIGGGVRSLFTPSATKGAGNVSPEVQTGLDMIEKSGAKVKVNPKTPGQEGNVTLDYGEAGRVNVRVETHPLKPGGPPQRHGNVEVIKDVNGKPVKERKDHITD